MQHTTQFPTQRCFDLNKAQTAVNLMYRVSEVIDNKNDFTSYSLKIAIAGKAPLAVTLRQVAEQSADPRSRDSMVQVLGSQLINDILKWYRL